MKGFAFITAAVFAGQAFAIPSYSQQNKRAGDGNSVLELEEEVYGIWINACPSLNIPNLYCINHIWEKCIVLFSDTTSKVQRGEWLRDDLKIFEADLKACVKPRDPATDAGLCYDQNLSGEACQKYAKEFREKNKYILGIEQGDKPQEPPKAEQRPNYGPQDVMKAVQEACTKRGITTEECNKAAAQCIWACTRPDEVHRDCPRPDKQTVATPDDIGVCVAKVEI